MDSNNNKKDELNMTAAIAVKELCEDKISRS